MPSAAKVTAALDPAEDVNDADELENQQHDEQLWQMHDP
jgi:hypothetical protein